MENFVLKRCLCAAASLLLLLSPTAAAAKMAPSTLGKAVELFAATAAAAALPQGGAAVVRDYILDRQFSSLAAEEDTQTQDEPAPSEDENVTEQADEQQLNKEQLISLIPEQRRGVIETVKYASSGDGENYITYKKACIRNAADIKSAAILAAIEKEQSVSVPIGSDQPQVLIVHTHTSECYEQQDIGFYDSERASRSLNDDENMIAVGAVLAETLNSLGINTVQATEYHDYPAYTGAYTRSRQTVEEYLKRYPSIKIVLDIHRDAVERSDGTRIKPTANIDGQNAAQMMIIVCADDGSGNMPYQMQNLRFAADLQDEAQSSYPSLMRPILFDERKYNQDMLPGYLLIEIGGHASTLEEAKYSASLLAKSLYKLWAQ